MDGFEQEFRIPGQPLSQHRRLKLLQQLALHGEILRLPAVQPELHRPEQDGRRGGGRDRQRRAQPDAVRKRREIGGGPDQKHGRDRQQADGAAPPRKQAHQQQRQHDGKHRVDGAGRAVAQQPVPRQELRNGSGHDLDARHDGIERRGKDVAAAGDGRPDHDDAVSNRLRRNRPVQHRGCADGIGRCRAGRRTRSAEHDRCRSECVVPPASGYPPGSPARCRSPAPRRAAGTTVRPCRGFETASARRVACRTCR